MDTITYYISTCCGYCTVVKSLLELLFFVVDDVAVVVVVFR